MKHTKLHAGMLLLLALLLCVALPLAACTDSPEKPANNGTTSTTASTTSTTGSSAPARLTYTVKVVDAEGNPVAGVEVQICDGDRCLLPAETDANGEVSWKTTSGNFKAQIKSAPAGYTYESEYPFPAEGTALTVTLAAA